MNASKQRFVREYANFKISVLTDLMKNFPGRTVILTANITVIKSLVKKWDDGLITTDEVMKAIAEF